MLLISGCGAKEETSNGAAKDTPKDAEAVEIVMVILCSSASNQPNILLPLVDELAEKSDGRIKLTIHAGGSVTSPATIREDVATGVIDMADFARVYTANTRLQTWWNCRSNLIQLSKHHI